ncbi:Hypothetical predicted protein [Mytilus galloprovincialis]|uniref:Reverse transcriptase domain-containing protein n=1 Tax=Mytilus galloprovincialis TaxID=29158 RepID=A0A8B6GBZ3_MYTGA|nr:Hypothetical predicted protein [Mytilus galloprovincialis]
MQLAYRTGHSLETTLIRVHHDITNALDNKSCVVLLMVDLSAAFDVIDQEILFDSLQYTFGLSGTAWSWLRSYFSQCVFIGSFLPDNMDNMVLKYGVSQGSIMGPRLYTMF